MHHQCVAPLAANSPHSGLSRANSIASSKVRLCRDRSFFRVAIQMNRWRHCIQRVMNCELWQKTGGENNTQIDCVLWTDDVTIMTSSSKNFLCMFKNNFPTKRIFRIFHILRINGMAPFCNLFMERSSYKPAFKYIYWITSTDVYYECSCVLQQTYGSVIFVDDNQNWNYNDFANDAHWTKIKSLTKLFLYMYWILSEC